MAVVSVCSTKGGVGKTTLVICVADELSRQGYKVAIVDADPNGHVAAWKDIIADQSAVDVIPGATEATIQDLIEKAQEVHDVVFVDLEGAASQAVTWAISMSDAVLMPTRTSGMDLQELLRTYQVVQRIERALKRKIDARAVFSQIPPLANRISTHARGEVSAEGIIVLNTEIIARPNGYGGIHFNGITPSHPDGDEKAKNEIKAIAAELLEILQAGAA